MLLSTNCNDKGVFTLVVSRFLLEVAPCLAFFALTSCLPYTITYRYACFYFYLIMFHSLPTFLHILVLSTDDVIVHTVRDCNDMRMRELGCF